MGWLTEFGNIFKPNRPPGAINKVSVDISNVVQSEVDASQDANITFKLSNVCIKIVSSGAVNVNITQSAQIKAIADVHSAISALARIASTMNQSASLKNRSFLNIILGAQPSASNITNLNFQNTIKDTLKLT